MQKGSPIDGNLSQRLSTQSAGMVAPSPPHSCRFIWELIDILADDSAVPKNWRDELLFSDLVDLEMDAERFGASEATCRVIGRVRHLAALGAIRSKRLPPEVS